MSKGKIIGIVSIKGGVGKTTSVVNLASSLANDYSKKVLIVDTNFTSPNIGLHLGSVEHKATLHEVLKDKVKINEAIYNHQYGFHFLPGSLYNSNPTNYSKLKQKLQPLKKYYDYVLLDASNSLNDELVASLHASDELYVVTTPDLPTLSTTLRAVKLAKEKGLQIRGLILNKVRGKNYELKKEDIERLTGIPVISIINENVKVLEALSNVKPITLYSPYSPVALSYKKLAALLSNSWYKEPSLFKKTFGYVKDDFFNFVNHDFKNGLKYY